MIDPMLSESPETMAATKNPYGGVAEAEEWVAVERPRPGLGINDSIAAAADGPVALSHDEVAAHAYRCWEERGCPDGSPEEDWHRAERELRERHTQRASAANA